MDAKKNAFDMYKETAFKRVQDMSPAFIEEQVTELTKRIRQEKFKAQRTIKPVRLLLSIDAFILLDATRKLTHIKEGERPYYEGLVVHPSVFHSTDIDPYQIVILG